MGWWDVEVDGNGSGMEVRFGIYCFRGAARVVGLGRRAVERYCDIVLVVF